MAAQKEQDKPPLNHSPKMARYKKRDIISSDTLFDLGAEIEAESQLRLNDKFRDAAENGDYKEVERFLKIGVEIDSTTVQGWTALSLAAGHEHTQICDLLIKNGADMEVKDRTAGRTVLHWAAYRGFAETCALLIKEGADTVVGDLHKKTALMLAAEYGYAEICLLLLENGADVNAEDNIRRTARDYALSGTQNQYRQTSKLLFKIETLSKVLNKENVGPFLAQFRECTGAILWH
jgi:ankyrin repeat protein